MSAAWRLAGLDEPAVARLAELVALKVRPGDAILLEGDLGAGKTTLARALIRALLGDAEAEVPSPTFPIVQPYATPRLPVAHFDLYRLSGAAELAEVGFDEAVATGAVIVEWPGRAADAMPADRITIVIAEGSSPDTRDVTLSAEGGAAERLARLKVIARFLAGAVPGGARPDRIGYLQGDASTRSYARVEAGGTSFVLMDAPRMPDGPPVRNGLPYSRIARLAEDVRPFVAIDAALGQAGITVPTLYAGDLEAGPLLLEDPGDLTFARPRRACRRSVCGPQRSIFSSSFGARPCRSCCPCRTDRPTGCRASAGPRSRSS